MSQKPMRVDEAMRLAVKLARKGDIDGARAVYEDVIARFPGNARARQALADLESPQVRMRGGFTQQKAETALGHYRAGRNAEALKEIEALIAAFPDRSFLFNLRGVVRGRMGDHTGAEADLREAIRIEPTLGDAYSNLGDRMVKAGRPEEAIDVLRDAIRLMETPAEAWNNLGNAFHALGRFDEARDAYQRCVDLKPKLCAAHRNLALVKTYVENDPHIAQMGTMLQQPMGADDHAHLSFALSKACEDIGKDSHAFDLLAHGNRLKRSKVDYSPERDRALFAKIRACFAEPPFPEAERTGDGPTPIFIVGMPRSGTSLVEQIVASHSKVFGCGELDSMRFAVEPLIESETPLHDRAAAQRIRQHYLADLSRFSIAEPFAADKLPINFRWIGFMLSAFPEAKIVHTRRNPVATGFSIYKQFFPADGLAFSWDLADIANYYALYTELMAFWHETFPGRIHDLDYEELTENQEDETRRLLAFCGFDLEPACLDFHTNRRAVLTASAMQVREKIYTGSSEAWRKYEDRLEPLLRLAG